MPIERNISMTIKQLASALAITTVLLSASACNTAKSKTVYPIAMYTTEFVQALNYAVALKKAGGLPGFKTDDQADVVFNSGYKSDNLSEPIFTFPIEATFAAVKEVEKESVYHYVMRKENFEASWKLVKAWKAAQDGTIIIADLFVALAK
jgi:hypothetical protein